MALELKYKLAVQEKEEAENKLTKIVRLKLCIYCPSFMHNQLENNCIIALHFLQLESGLLTGDPGYKDRQGRSQTASLHLRAELTKPLSLAVAEEEEKEEETEEEEEVVSDY